MMTINVVDENDNPLYDVDGITPLRLSIPTEDWVALVSMAQSANLTTEKFISQTIFRTLGRQHEKNS